MTPKSNWESPDISLSLGTPDGELDTVSSAAANLMGIEKHWEDTGRDEFKPQEVTARKEPRRRRQTPVSTPKPATQDSTSEVVPSSATSTPTKSPRGKSPEPEKGGKVRIVADTATVEDTEETVTVSVAELRAYQYWRQQQRPPSVMTRLGAPVGTPARSPKEHTPTQGVDWEGETLDERRARHPASPGKVDPPERKELPATHPSEVYRIRPPSTSARKRGGEGSTPTIHPSTPEWKWWRGGGEP